MQNGAANIEPNPKAVKDAIRNDAKLQPPPQRAINSSPRDQNNPTRNVKPSAIRAVIIPYLSFNVVSANSANTSAIIQNRAITFDSDHPINSK